MSSEKSILLITLERCIQVSDRLPETVKRQMSDLLILNEETIGTALSISTLVGAYYKGAGSGQSKNERDKKLAAIKSAKVELEKKRFRLEKELDKFVEVMGQVDQTLRGRVVDRADGEISDNADLELAFKMMRSSLGRGGRDFLPEVKEDHEKMSKTKHPSSSSGESEIAGGTEVWCLCQKGAFGDMIACDYENCHIEWFHYGCVGVVEPPEGNWYCPLHSPDSRKKNII